MRGGAACGRVGTAACGRVVGFLPPAAASLVPRNQRPATNNARRARARRASGFTLLEALVALLILAMSLTAIVEIQGLSSQAVIKARDLTLVTQLARGKMYDLILEIRKKGFGEFEETLECDFEDEEHPEIGCSATLTKVEIPLPGESGLDAGGAGDLAGGALGSQNTEATGMIEEATKGVVSMYGGMIRDMVSEALRELTLTVTWMEGGTKERSFTVSTHLIDVMRAGGQGLPGGSIPGLPGGAGGLGKPGSPGLPRVPGGPGNPLTPNIPRVPGNLRFPQ